MAEFQPKSGNRPKILVILPTDGDDQVVSLELGLEQGGSTEHLGPLAGPPDMPEPDLTPKPDYGPRKPVKGGTRGFFLDRYVY